jgi:DnaK suppressor protein
MAQRYLNGELMTREAGMDLNDLQEKPVLILKEMKTSIENEMAKLKEALKTEVDADADEADPDLVEREKTMALYNSLENRLKAIDFALYKLKNGTYGKCESCGEPIDPARLEAVPEATLCIKCKAKAESKIYRGPVAPLDF